MQSKAKTVTECLAELPKDRGAALASQKNYMSLYLLCRVGDAPVKARLQAGFEAAGKKLDMGGSCVRFKRLDDLPLELIGEVIGAEPMRAYVARAQKASARKK